MPPVNALAETVDEPPVEPLSEPVADPVDEPADEPVAEPVAVPETEPEDEEPWLTVMLKFPVPITVDPDLTCREKT